MRFWYDTEFLENGETIDLISIAFVSERGGEFYRVSSEFDELRVGRHSWLRANVVPHLPLRKWPTNSAWLDLDSPLVEPRGVIRRDLLQWLSDELDGSPNEPRSIELRAWYGAYDHVALMQLWGSMVDHPGGLPMFTGDVRERWRELGEPSDLPAQRGFNHDALGDARWNHEAELWMDEHFETTHRRVR